MTAVDTHPGPLPPCGVGGRAHPLSIFGEFSNMVPAKKFRRLTIDQLWGAIARVRGGGGARFLGNLERVAGLVESRKKFGNRLENEKSAEPPIWPIALNGNF